VPEPLLLLPFFLKSIGGNAMTAMASIAGMMLTAAASRWKNNSSKSGLTGQFDWPMATETHISYQLR
jgi:hypothetical protein